MSADFSDRWDGVTLTDALDAAARRYGNREAYVFEDARLTYAGVAEKSNRVARALFARGLRRGDRIGVILGGYSQWPELYFGAARIGVIVVPVNIRFKMDELDYALGRAAVRLIFIHGGDCRDRAYGPLLLGAATRSGALREHFPQVQGVIDIAATDEEPRSLANFLRSGSENHEAAFAAACAQVGPQDIALVMYTSGTTAQPKGAQLCHSGILRGAAYGGERMHLTADDRLFTAQPFYHSGGAVAMMLMPIVLGTLVVVQRSFDARLALAMMERERATALIGHQPHWIEYLNDDTRTQRQLALKKAFILATPEVNHRVSEEFGISLISPYGLTETSLGGTASDLDDDEEVRLTTVGRPYPGMELQIRDTETNTVLGPGQVGEVLFRGWGIMKGYLGDDIRTTEAIEADGWFHTGDLGMVGNDGNLQLRGRIKETIRVGGENVAAVEVEDLLLRHPAVKQAVVVGKRDARLGEVCCAFIEKKADAPAADAEDLIAFCRERLANFKIPREIRFVAEWPISSGGKIERAQLRKALEEA